MVVFSLLLFQETLHNSCREHKPLLRPIKVYRYVLVINCVYRSCAKRFMRQHTADLNTRKINFRGAFYRILRLCQYAFRLLRNCLCYRLRCNDGLFDLQNIILWFLLYVSSLWLIFVIIYGSNSGRETWHFAVVVTNEGISTTVIVCRIDDLGRVVTKGSVRPFAPARWNSPHYFELESLI